jgi:two-component system chemotaxis response regulator CheY
MAACSGESLRPRSAPSQVLAPGADLTDVTDEGQRLALVIDDSRAMRSILKRILLPLGFEVREAPDGRAALDMIWNEDLQPLVALIDWNMPVMNGLEFVVAVRKQKHLRQMTLMMVTTESEHSQIVRALAAGAHEYVIKPFTADAVVNKLAYLGLTSPNEFAGDSSPLVCDEYGYENRGDLSRS